LFSFFSPLLSDVFKKIHRNRKLGLEKAKELWEEKKKRRRSKREARSK